MLLTKKHRFIVELKTVLKYSQTKFNTRRHIDTNIKRLAIKIFFLVVQKNLDGGKSNIFLFVESGGGDFEKSIPILSM